MGIGTQNMKGIGRNEPCPCGSGKKHKRCCVDRPARILDPSLRGIIVPVGRGSIAIVGEPGEALDAVERAVRIATRGRNGIEQNA